MNQDTFFEHLSQHYASNLPFVAYRKPSASIINAMLQNDDAIHIASDFSKSGFVFAPFDDRQNAVLIPSNHAKSIETQYNIVSKSEPSQKVSFISEEGKDKHIKLVQKGIDIIKTTDLIKVVLSRKELVKLSENNPIDIFKHLLDYYATAFVYCWYHPNIGLWLGATPETLLKVEGNRFSTMALAGTQPYQGALDIEWQQKEVEEQQIVTDFIVNSLSTKASVVKISDVETVKAGHLLHLKTQITGLLNADLKYVIKQIHPTPAICGFPREVAKQFILDSEDYNREFYTGFLGELNLKKKQSRNSNRRNVENNAYGIVKNTSELFVNLRCMKLKNNYAEVFVGGGITKDSIPENEWQETINKTKTMKRVIVF